MKVTIFFVVILATSCLSLDDFWNIDTSWGGNDDIFGSDNERNEWSHRLGAELHIYNGVPSLTGRYTATFDDTFATSVHGTVDTYGNWLVGAYLGWRFKRNAAGKKLYSVSFQIDPCNFITYDIDRNDEIVLGEMHAIFGDSEMALRLFIDMDENGNRVIEKEEFYNQAPQFIKECSVLDPNEGED